MATRSSDMFQENERPTAKRDRLDAVDFANAANKTQELNPRELLGAEVLESSRPLGATTSGTRAVVTGEEIARFKTPTPVKDPSAERADAPTVGTPVSGSPVAEAETAEEAPIVAGAASVEPRVRRARFVTWHEGQLFLTPALFAIAVVLALIAGFLVGHRR